MTGPVAFDAVALLPVLAPALGAVLVLVLDAVAPGLHRVHLPLAAAINSWKPWSSRRTAISVKPAGIMNWNS